MNLVDLINAGIASFCSNFERLSYWGNVKNIQTLVAVVLVSFVCGAIGTLVVGKRMAFFSDALAHCAWAGVALGLALFLLARYSVEDYLPWLMPIMVGFGIVMSLLITYVQEKTGLPNDTVIGVFFAGALGMGAVAIGVARKRFDVESFIFGDPINVHTQEIVWLLGLTLLTALFFLIYFNSFVLASVNTSLARSRRMPIVLTRYLFALLLGLTVNICLQIVGTLLVNGILIIPAAAAANFARNLRQFVLWAVVLSVLTGVLGHILSWEVATGTQLRLGFSGPIVVMNVLVFALSAVLAYWLPLLYARYRRQ